MGRYYFGQISGKFWFGFQNSDDASYFGVNYKHVRNFYVCCCELLQPPARCAVTTEFNHSPNSVVALRSEESSKIDEDSGDLATDIYCTDCYSSYEEHKQAMIDEDVELYDEDDFVKIEGFTINEIIHNIAKSKVKDYKSLTTKSLFKFMDMVDM